MLQNAKIQLFIFGCNVHGWGGYAEMTHPSPKSCSKHHKMPKSNFSFLGVTSMFGQYGEMTHPNSNPKSCSKCHKIPKSNSSFLGPMFMVEEYGEMTHPNPKSCSKMSQNT